MTFVISGNIIDIVKRKIFPGSITIHEGKIESILPEEKAKYANYILPGFIDAHIHIESSLLIPSEFARLATPHGTVATVSDPHEIANVLGPTGIHYMIENSKKVPFYFFFGAPSCVPATAFETSGALINAEDIRELFEADELPYLSEMMNYPGVLNQNPEVMAKIRVAKELRRPIDGHAPGLMGQDAERYIKSGITTDHECFKLDEALNKLKHHMKIIIREGSAAKNYEALHTLLKSHPEEVMFCSDDKHPHELAKGHINELVKRSFQEKGYDLMDVLRCASYNPVNHYHLDVGLLQIGDPADFIIVDNLQDFNVKATYIKGQMVAENGKTLIESVSAETPNAFNTEMKKVEDFKLRPRGTKLQVIEALDGQLITKKSLQPMKTEKGNVISDPSIDVLKLTVVNRYSSATPAIAFIKGFNLKEGAIASSIAHDSHNIIAVGTSDQEICDAVNALIEIKGGLAVVRKGEKEVLSLPVAGLMSPDDGFIVAERYSQIAQRAKALGSTLHDPFMTLSFMALLVIPSLKLSDKGLFDGTHFQFTDVSV
jgi:adenine deaminase